MAGKKSSGLGGIGLILLSGLGYLLLQYGTALLVVGAIAIAFWLAYKVLNASSGTDALPPRPPAPAPVAPRPTPIARRVRTVPAPSSRSPVGISISLRGTGYVSGEVTSRNGDEFWQDLTSDGKPLGAQAYVGKGLAAVSGDGIEPALIASNVAIDRSVRDCTFRRLEYWPSYCRASEQARGAYLHWLATGLKDPNADLGYVFLYFYGLERRVLYDAMESEAAREQVPNIAKEIERLLSIYGRNRSFQTYAGSLLDLLNNRSVDARLYESGPPPLRSDRELTFRHRVALGQCAADGAPLPAEWAHAWCRSSPLVSLRTPALRCPDEFRSLFLLRYRAMFGDGIKLKANRTLLKMSRRPASPTFGWEFSGHTLQFRLPDVTVQTEPMRQMQEVADYCCERLAAYSRLVGKKSESDEPFDGLVELPVALWPEEARRSIERVRGFVESSGKPLVVPFETLQSWLPDWPLANKKRWQALGKALEEVEVGVEPDVRYSGSAPSFGSPVALFADDAPSSTSRPSPRFRAAALTLQLGAAVALADGASQDAENGLMSRQLEEWLQLTESERRRLHAYMRLVLAAPPKLNGVKAKLEALNEAQRESVGDFLALIALADGVITPEEIAALEKTFRTLGLNPKSVFAKVHIAATEPITVLPAAAEPSGRAIPKGPSSDAPIRLDPARLAMLQADSDRVSTLLGEIFAPSPADLRPAEPEEEATVELASEDTLFGLDGEHSAIARILLSRAQWRRGELEELAADRGFMLDGVLEHINDAAFERLSKPLFEGDDPIDINQEVAHEVLQ